MAAKMSLQNKHLGNDDYFVIISSSSHQSILTELAANGPVEAPLKLMPENERFTVVCSRCR